MRSAGPASRRDAPPPPAAAAAAAEEWGGRGEANCGGIASAVRARRLDLSLEEEKLNFFDEEDGALGGFSLLSAVMCRIYFHLDK